MSARPLCWDDSSFTGVSAVLDTSEMYKADSLAMAAGVPGAELMEAAGAAVADALHERWPDQPVTVLCGPGNNGGDGFVAARLLSGLGHQVRLAHLGSLGSYSGDAAEMVRKWAGESVELAADVFLDGGVVIDALFGAGLGRPIKGLVAEVIEAIGDRPVVAVDMPSGVRGDDGVIEGAAVSADVTVTFFRVKPGHLLYPGREFCGDLILADIGIPDEVLGTVSPMIARNEPDLWLDLFPFAEAQHHKFSRGYALVAAGPEMTGAGRLAARAAQRIGAGFVTIACAEKTAPLYRVSLESVVVRGYRDTTVFREVLEDERLDACLIGPGMGQAFGSQERVLHVLRSGVAAVLDADALTVFEGAPELLLDTISAPCVLTPHEGEFRRIFPDIEGATRVEQVRAAAKRAGCVVLLKGPDTVIADADGRVVINDNAPPELATAGAGDVLAGLITGLLSQGVAPLEAAAMACWVHGRAASLFGPGLIAEDLSELLPEVLREILTLRG